MKLRTYAGSFPAVFASAADTVRGGRNLNDLPAIRSDDGREIAVVTLSGYRIGEEPSPEQWRALLAAAPDMLAAAKPIAKAADNYADCDDGFFIDNDATITVGQLRSLRAAIAKAEPGQKIRFPDDGPGVYRMHYGDGPLPAGAERI